MYIPQYFEMEDPVEMLEFMRAYPFATIVSERNGELLASHLPCVVGQLGEKIILYTHLASANPQCAQLEHSVLMAIFQEPQAYISPKLYEHQRNVPTWNFLAVHAYGQGKLHKSPEEKVAFLEKTIAHLEPEYFEQWQRLPEEYKRPLLDEIEALSIELSAFRSQKKISQNRKKSEQERIAKELLAVGKSHEQDIGRRMMQVSKGKQF
jgi:transcriptional regulator